jgi:hypothetical protein
MQPILRASSVKDNGCEHDRLTGSLRGNALEDVVDERVEDGHGLV